MGFIDTINITAEFMSTEDVEKLKDHDIYNTDAEKLAIMMVDGLKERADLGKVKLEFDAWVDSRANEDDEEIEVEGGQDQAEMSSEGQIVAGVGEQEEQGGSSETGQALSHFP